MSILSSPMPPAYSGATRFQSGTRALNRMRHWRKFSVPHRPNQRQVYVARALMGIGGRQSLLAS